MNIDNETIERVEQLGEQIGRMYSSAFIHSTSELLRHSLQKEIKRCIE